MNNWVEGVGLLGSFLSSITFIPQVYQAWKTKSVGDLNVGMISIVIFSTIVWLVYGVFYDPMLWPVVICNSIICVLALMLLYFKFTFPKK